MRHLVVLLPVRLLLIVLLALTGGQSLSRPTVIASPLSSKPLPAVQQAPSAASAVKRSRSVTVSLDRMPTPGSSAGMMADTGVPIRLDLFADVSVDLEFERFETNPRGTTWIGRVTGQPASHVTLVYGDGLMTGSVVIGDATYAIRPAPADARSTDASTAGVLHVVSEIDQAGFRREAEPVEPPLRSSARQRAAADGGYSDPADIIDLLVVYTPGSVTYAGGTAGLHNLVTLGVAETNTSYATSGVTHRLRLAHMAEVPHAEHTNSLQVLHELRLGTGGFAGVAALRDSWAADVVMLVQFSGAPTCGIAFLMTTPSVTSEDAAFSVVEADCVSPNYTFAHELGHNMGLRHDWYVDSETTPYPYGHGHVSTVPHSRWRTIMSYGDLCAATGAGCPRLLAWSNPAVLHQGLPMGVPAGTNTSCTTGSLTANSCDADDRQALDNSAVYVANFRHAIPGPFATTTPDAGQVVHPGSRFLEWTPSFRATGYEYCIDTTANDTCDTGWVAVGDATNTLLLDLPPTTTYAWQVRAINAAGIVEADAGTWSTFSTGPAPHVDFARNGSFAAGFDHWLQYATPDSSHIVAQVGSGALEFYRLSPAGSTPNQAVVFQQTGTPLVAGTSVQLQFDLGNSDTLHKRIGVVVHDVDFSDLAVCTFWLPPNAPLATFGMRSHTTEGWADAHISFYAASAGSNGGFYQVDNVSIRYAPEAPATRTDCVDPFTPAPGGAADSANLIVNGTFGAGTLAPWSAYGTIAHEIVSGVMRFVRPTAAAPSGALLQATGQPMAAGEILTASFQLGNSSGVRKRVTAILHDADFSDLSACTFWLPPGQPLSSYAYRAYTTRPWMNATLSIYPATVGTDEWILFDNVTLRQTPGATIVGTECLEPATGPDHPVDVAQADSYAAASRTLPGSVAAALVIDDTWRNEGFISSAHGATWESVIPSDGARHTLESTTPLDLRARTRATLAFDSWLTSSVARASVDVSVDGVTWLTMAVVDASDNWMPVEVDLTAFSGHVVYLRFVVSGSGPDVPGDWWRIDAILLSPSVDEPGT